MGYTREELNELTDNEIEEIYKDNKNNRLKLYRLKNGNYSVYYEGMNIFESPSKRISTIEFILEHSIKRVDNMDYNNIDYLKNLFGFN